MTKRMGRGIRSILEGEHREETVTQGEGQLAFAQVPVKDIQANPNQPRTTFDPEDLADLANSIRARGVLQPIVVQKAEGGKYQLIAGERRWRASIIAEQETIPAVVRQVDQKSDELVLAIVENVQRSDLDAIEKAEAFRRLTSDYQLTQEEVARVVGLNRASIANFIRLLDLPEDIQQLVSLGHLKMGHARAILGVTEVDVQRAIAAEVVKRSLSVRATEELVNQTRTSVIDRPNEGQPPRQGKAPEWVRQKEKDLSARVGAKVKIRHASSGAGVLILKYRDPADLERLTDLLSS